MPDYNKIFYKKACEALRGLTHYYADIQSDCVAYLLRYFPSACEKELAHAVNWALADTWGDGCEFTAN